MKIEKNVPLNPPGRGRNLSDLTKTLLAMESGDSIFLGETDKGTQKRMYNSVYKSAKRHDIKVAVRFYADGIRVWRQ